MLELVHPTPADNAAEGSYTDAEMKAMQHTILRLFEHWGVSDADAAIILGGIAPRTVSRWRAGELGRATRDLGDRMSLLLGIHKSLRIIFEEPGRGYRWIKAPNDAFGGRSALDILRQGGMADIARLRSYLDSVRGGW
jgi:hypothetical protein